MNRAFFILALSGILLSSCTEKNFISDDNLFVMFSDDTVHFDTVFTSIGTVTRQFKIYNPYDSWLRIDRVFLGKGSGSPFRLNVDGESSYDVKYIELAPNDSIFVFVDALIDPTNSNNPIAVMDSIIVDVGSNSYDINLLAWGQDINLINGAIVGTETWTDEKPYVVYNSMLVDTGQILTISEGTRILFHRGSQMYVAGTLRVNGTADKQVVFGSDRLENEYTEIPGQWAGIYFINISTGNRITGAIIENAVSGIHVGNINSNDQPPDLLIENTLVRHMTVSGISSLGGTINASNTVITHCGYYCLFLAMGGEYNFTHCSVMNQWEYALRLTPAVAISDWVEINDIIYTGILAGAEFNNSVVYGQQRSEIVIFPLEENSALNCSFNSNLIKIDEENEDWKFYDLTSCIINTDPLYIDPSKYDLRPDTLSPLIDMADPVFSLLVPFDARNADRFKDKGPDIGAYERQIGELSYKW